MDKPLQGKKIMVTRDPTQAGSLIDKLASLGSTVLPFPTIKIMPPDDWTACDQAIEDLSSFDWIIFSSANGVKYFMKRLEKKHKSGITCLIAVVGKKTAVRLKKFNLKADLIPDKYNARGLLKAFERIDLKGQKVLIPTSNIGKNTLKKGLAEKGAEVIQVVCYQTLPFTDQALKLKDQLENQHLDCITFFSPSAFNTFISLGGETFKNNKAGQQPALAAIGPATASAIRKKGLEVNILPEQSVEESMIKAIIDYFNKN